ncbi:unnamed protein product [marine sediment metagenome]|uniref:Uncharacterized protein n=1 Tax=marine sediment metagenome TaxID=412755 RepID=X0VRV8_9ZZZZ
MAKSLIKPLFDSPLDIMGDVHAALIKQCDSCSPLAFSYLGEWG